MITTSHALQFETAHARRLVDLVMIIIAIVNAWLRRLSVALKNQSRMSASKSTVSIESEYEVSQHTASLSCLMCRWCEAGYCEGSCVGSQYIAIECFGFKRNKKSWRKELGSRICQRGKVPLQDWNKREFGADHPALLHCHTFAVWLCTFFIQVSELNSLNAIHVAGTKGKVRVCVCVCALASYPCMASLLLCKGSSHLGSL